MLKALENEALGSGPLRTVENLAFIGRIWRVVAPETLRIAGDGPMSRLLSE